MRLRPRSPWSACGLRAVPALLLALAVLGGCARGGGANQPFPRFAEYEGREVEAVRFLGELVLPRDSLAAVIVTQASRCQLLFLPFCIPGTDIGRERQRLDLRALAEDVVRLQLYHRDHGYYGTRVAVHVESRGEEEVAVHFGIAPGDRVTVSSLQIEGTDTILPVQQLRARLPLQEGDPFRRGGFLAAADSIRNALFARGYAYADVLRNYDLDTIADVADLQYAAIPGPVVRVDTIVFLGLDRLGERTARRQLTFRKGDLLRAAELARSQRNLYGLGIVSFASVNLAPDSLQVAPDSADATVVVRVVEAPQYAVDVSAGYGSIDCLRSAAGWTDRNFLGGGRRLQLSGTVSKIGVAEPTAWGLADNVLCGQLKGDSLSQELNYRLVADFLQPRLFATQNQLGLRLHAERVSEYRAYLRESVGSQLSLARTLGAGTLLSANADVFYGSTEANAVVFCLGLNICSPEVRSVLTQKRWSNALSLSLGRERTRGDPNALRGYTTRAVTSWAPAALSDDHYLNLLVEGVAYRPLRPGWQLALRLQGGTFFIGSLLADSAGRDARFIPPERRFYAGGPNSVRGFARNALGPVAYLTEDSTALDSIRADLSVEPTSAGGTQLLVGSAELRVPSPLLSDVLRFAAFVDAGQVWARRSDLPASRLRVTPGVGLRFLTPVGPFRMDVAYNGYGSEPGRLFYPDPETGQLRLLSESFRPETGSFWNRLQFHFAVGQAF